MCSVLENKFVINLLAAGLTLADAEANKHWHYDLLTKNRATACAQSDESCTK